MPGGVRHPSRRIPGVKAQIKGGGALPAPAQVSTSYLSGSGTGEGRWPRSPGATPLTALSCHSNHFSGSME